MSRGKALCTIISEDWGMTRDRALGLGALAGHSMSRSYVLVGGRVGRGRSLFKPLCLPHWGGNRDSAAEGFPPEPSLEFQAGWGTRREREQWGAAPHCSAGRLCSELEVMVGRRPHAVLAKGKAHPHPTSSWAISARSRAGCESVCGFPGPGTVGAQMHLCF